MPDDRSSTSPETAAAERFVELGGARRGGMGAIVRARDLRTGASVALKRLRYPTPEAYARFAREAEALATLQHEAIVRYVEHGTLASGEMFLAMEWLEGEDLADRLARGPLSIAEAVALAGRVASALEVAHARGVVHRDVKPANIFLPEKELARAKLLDFGIARASSRIEFSTQAGAALGTPGYMAPEQARGERDVDARADVFGLGCVLFEALTGAPLFRGHDAVAALGKLLLEERPTLAERGVHVTPHLEALVAAMLGRTREERPSDGGAVVGALAAIEREELLVAPPEIVPVLTARELRLVTVVLASPSDDPVDAFESTWEGGDKLLRLDQLERLAGASARVELLRDGSIIAAFSGATSARDQVAAAGRFALALDRALEGARIGVATERAELRDALIVGGAIDAAARLASVAGPGEVRVDAVTSGLLDGTFHQDESVSPALLRGPALAERPRRLMGRATPFVGRERELSELRDVLLEGARAPGSRAVLLLGAPGAGKSRLRYELFRSLRAELPTLSVWSGRGDPARAGAPLGVLLEALRGALVAAREPGSQPMPVASPELVRRLEAFVEELGRALRPEDGDAEWLEPRLPRAALERGFVELVEAACATAPLAIVLEDLQWGDAASVRLLDAALGRLAHAPLLVVATARDDISEKFPRIWVSHEVTRVRLARLSRRAQERLAREVLGDVDPKRLAELVERADGNAFHLEELLRATRTGEAVPETLVATLQARLDAASPEARRVLRAASVLGDTFWRGAVVALVGERGLDAAFAELTTRELVERRWTSRFAGELELAFRHGLLREAAYGALTGEDRALGHKLAAGWLERAGEPSRSSIAEHLERAGDRPRARAAFRAAAEQAAEASDFDGAFTCVARALAAGAEGEERGKLLALEAVTALWAGQHQRASEVGRRALTLVPTGTPAWFHALRAHGSGLSHVGQHSDESLELALVELERRPSPSGALTAASLASQAMFAGRLGLVDRVVACLEAIAGESPVVRGSLETLLAHRASLRGDPSGALAALERAAQAFELAGRTSDARLQRANVGFYLLMLGRFDDALATLRSLRAEVESSGPPRLLWLTLSNLGSACFSTGNLDEGEALQRRALAGFIEMQSPRLEAAASASLARVLLARGAVLEAEGHATRAVEASSSGPPTQADALAVLARIRLAQARPREALELAERARALVATVGGVEGNEGSIDLAHIEALLALKQAERARTELVRAIGRLDERARRLEERHRASYQGIPDHARLRLLERELGNGLLPGR